MSTVRGGDNADYSEIAAALPDPTPTARRPKEVKTKFSSIVIYPLYGEYTADMT